MSECLCRCGCGRDVGVWPRSRRTGKNPIVRGECRRFINGHSRRKNNYTITTESGCHEWQGMIDINGYGVISVDGHRRRAHRAYWERDNGPIPGGMEIDHLCRNRRCVNPAHMEVVTHAVNMRRSSLSKLTQSDVDEIRRIAHTESRASIARRYGVSAPVISNIVNGKTWR